MLRILEVMRPTAWKLFSMQQDSENGKWLTGAWLDPQSFGGLCECGWEWGQGQNRYIEGLENAVQGE